MVPKFLPVAITKRFPDFCQFKTAFLSSSLIIRSTYKVLSKSLTAHFIPVFPFLDSKRRSDPGSDP